MLKKKNKLCVPIILCCCFDYAKCTTLLWMESSFGYAGKIFLEKSDENKAGKCLLLAWFYKFKVRLWT